MGVSGDPGLPGQQGDKVSTKLRSDLVPVRGTVLGH